MKNLMTQVCGLWLASSLVVSVVAAEAPAAYLPQEFAVVMTKLPAGNAKNGETVHGQKFCTGCHGKDGLSQNPAWPHVAGQPRDVTIKSLLDYRQGYRAKGAAVMMAGVAKALTDQQLVDVAVYYEAIPGADGTLKKENISIDPEVKRMIIRGDVKRAITPCATCHGMTGQGNINGQVPVLHGQNAAYMSATLKDYRSATRSSDILKEMRFFASKLTDKEIDQLAGYYASLKGWQP